MIAELDTIVLTRDLPERGLAVGDVGAVVHAYDTGAYEVEFVTGGGTTADVVTLTARDVRPIGAGEILHARQRASS